MREVYIGFDSAWTYNQRNPGGIAAYVIENGQLETFIPPLLVSFAEAAQRIEEWSGDGDYVLITIDQPTIVPNHDGCRPVDRVAGSLVSGLGGGVQPARQSSGGALMFGESAPIWNFISNVGAIQNPIEARNAATGRFLMEVFPALALPAIVPILWSRRRAAKYNPDRRKTFDLLDWQLVSSGTAIFANKIAASDLAHWLEGEVARASPRKADQDRLDAAICLAIGLAWRRAPISETLQIGDERTGYMATIVSAQTRAVLVKSAESRDVAIDQVWVGNASAVTAMREPQRLPVVQLGSLAPRQAPRLIPSAPAATEPARVDPTILRTLLIGRARLGTAITSITYGEVASSLGHRWSQGFGASLTRALRILAAENGKAGEPRLMCLVVNKETRLPGNGFYESIGHGGISATLQRMLLDKEVERCRRWSWR